MTTHREGTDAAHATDSRDASMKQQAADTAQAGKEAAANVAATATDAAKDVASQTGEQARDLLHKSRGELRDQVETQQVAVVANLRSLGDQLAEMTDHVEQDGTAVDLATQARDRVRGAADWLDGREPGEVLDELRKLGRNKPGAFLLGAAVAGVMAGRLTRGVVAVHTDDSPQEHGVRPAHRAADETGVRPRPAVGNGAAGTGGVAATGRPLDGVQGTVPR